MFRDARERNRYAQQTIDLLYPGERAAMRVIPSSLLYPRLAAPVGQSAVAREAILGFTAHKGPKAERVGRVVAAGIRAGVFGREASSRGELSTGETINTHLASALGENEVYSAFSLTGDRANRKPVLQVFNGEGRLLAYAKVGVTPLAAQLVTAEASAMREVSAQALGHVRTPDVLADGVWRDMPVLVTSPLAAGRAPDLRSDLLLEATREISHSRPSTTDDTEMYIGTLTERTSQLQDNGSMWHQAVAAKIIQSRDLGTLSFGAWHGDFTPWNCAANGDMLNVWDWERYVSPVPLGFDRLHYVLNSDVHGRGEDYLASAHRLVQTAPELLEPLGVTAEASTTAALFYLNDISLRYDIDGFRPRQQTIDWARPVIESYLGNTAL